MNYITFSTLGARMISSGSFSTGLVTLCVCVRIIKARYLFQKYHQAYKFGLREMLYFALNSLIPILNLAFRALRRPCLFRFSTGFMKE